MVQNNNILGYIVSQIGISTNTNKIDVIVNLLRPKNANKVQFLMGHYEYYRCFIHMYVVDVKPTCSLVENFLWAEEYEHSFENFKC